MGLILASASPRRQQLLRMITVDFTVCPTNVDETLPPELPLCDAAQFLARKKAQAAVTQFPQTIVIGADTTVLLEQQLLGKPKTPERAAQMLERLSGKTHQVITGVAIAKDHQAQSFQTQTNVTFYPLRAAEISEYVRTGEPLDKAGGYGIQGCGALLIQRIEGDYYGVVGLPVAPLARALRDWGVCTEGAFTCGDT
ncbi:MAG: Maf family protein [Ruminococcus sp.]|nr:Maf family protein [Ruminococcus sp.]